MTTLDHQKSFNPPLYVSRIPFDENRIRAAAIYCSDGRFGEQMDEFLHAGLDLPRYDRLAIPGGAACLCGHAAAFWQKTALEQQLNFLIQAHGLKKIVLIAHDGCAFYKSIDTGTHTIEHQQAQDLQTATESIQFWNPGIEVEKYFARKRNGKILFEDWNDY